MCSFFNDSYIFLFLVFVWLLVAEQMIDWKDLSLK